MNKFTDCWWCVVVRWKNGMYKMERCDTLTQALNRKRVLETCGYGGGNSSISVVEVHV